MGIIYYFDYYFPPYIFIPKYSYFAIYPSPTNSGYSEYNFL